VRGMAPPELLATKITRFVDGVTMLPVVRRDARIGLTRRDDAGVMVLVLVDD